MSTLSELRTRARRLADAVGNNFFSDAEINDYINTGLGELHDLLVLKFEDYYISSLSFSLTSNTSSYSLESIGLNNLYKLMGVDLNQGSETVRVPRYSFQERNTFKASQALYSDRGHTNHRYSLTGSNINFIPTPSSSDEVTVWYIPKYTKLVNDSDSVDDNIASNWEDYAVCSAAIKMRQKEETSTTSLERAHEKLTMRIEDAAANRDAGEPMGITDEDMGVLSGRWLYG
tara:strand:- start:14076 stop:14768 length:693 start_codon:yes stop_codon:yes gene_type:complete